MADYRDPKVTTTNDKKGNSMGKWIGIILAVIVALLLLAWLFGAFGTEVETNPAVVEEPVGEEGVVVE